MLRLSQQPPPLCRRLSSRLDLPRAQQVAAVMFVYNLTLHKATAVTAAIFGSFSAPKAQEIVVARGKVLELLRPDE